MLTLLVSSGNVKHVYFVCGHMEYQMEKEIFCGANCVHFMPTHISAGRIPVPGISSSVSSITEDQLNADEV